MPASPEPCRDERRHESATERGAVITSFVARCQQCINNRCIFQHAVLLSLAMQHTSTTPDQAARVVIKHKIHVDRIELRLVRLPLKEPFETSFGQIASRLIFLVSAEADGLRGWGEVVTAEGPPYTNDPGA